MVWNPPQYAKSSKSETALHLWDSHTPIVVNILSLPSTTIKGSSLVVSNILFSIGLSMTQNRADTRLGSPHKLLK